MPLIYYIPRRDAVTGAITTVVDTSFSQTSLLISSNLALRSFSMDASNFTNDVTVVGDARASSYTPYLPSWSVYLDGTGDYLTIPYNSSFNIPSSTPVTFEAWVYDNRTNAHFIMAGRNWNWGSGGPTWGFLVYNRVPTWQIAGTGSATFVMAQSSIGGTAGQWNHYAFTRDSGNVVRIFVNGVQGVSRTDSQALTSASGDVFIGRPSNGAVDSQGYISNARFVLGTAVYTSNFIPPTAPLTAIPGTSFLIAQDNRFIDKSPSNFAITKFGDTQITPFNPFTAGTVTTPTTYSTYFDGSGDYLSVPSSAAFAFGTGDFTIEAWVNFPANSTYRQIFSLRPSNGTNASQGSLAVNPSNGLNWYTSGPIVDYTSSIGVNQWVHVAVSRAGTTLRVFANGVLVGSATNSDNLTATNFSIGANNNGTESFNGYISNLRVVKGTAVYTANFTPPTTPLTAITNTSLLTCQNSTLIDNSTNRFTISSFGQAQPNILNPFGSSSTTNNIVTTPTTYSTYFDGSGDYLTVPATTQFNFGTGAFTVEFWVYPMAYGGTVAGGQLFGTANGSTSGYSINLGESNTRLRIISNATGSWADTLVAGTGPALNTWSHIAVVRSGANISIFINGSRAATSSAATTWNFSGTTGVIGRFYEGINTREYNGSISNLRVVKGTAVYDPTQATIVVPTALLTPITNTSLLTCQNATLIDNSTNAFTITSFGQAQPSPINPFGANSSSYSSTYSSALTTPNTYSTYFDGTGDYLSIPTNSALDFGSGDFTVEAWVNPNSLSSDWFIISASGSGGLFVGFISSSPAGYGWGRNAVAWDYRVASTATLNTWTHIAVTRSGTSMRLFVNGVQAGATQNISTAYSLSTTSTTIGSQGANWYLNGSISNLRVVKGTAVYTANFIPPTAPLTAISGTSLLTCQNATLIDNSTNAFTITSFGQAQPITANPFGANSSSYSSTYSSALTTPNTYSNYFDGTGDYLSIPDNEAFEFGSGSLTWEMWINTSSTTYFSWLYARFPTSLGAGMWALITNLSAAGDVAVYFGDFSPIAMLLRTSGGLVNDGAWHHIAVVRNGSAWVMYVDGISRATATWAGTISNISSGATIGGGATIPVGNPFTGYISNLRIVKGTAVYTANFTPSTSPLTAISGTSLLTCQNSSIIDNSTNNFTITVNGNTTTSRVNPFGFTSTGTTALTRGSAYFDGNGDYLTVPGNPGFNFGTGDHTIEAFIYWDGTYSATGRVICATGGSGSTDQLGIWDGQGIIYASIASNAYPPTNAWSHVAVSRQGSTVRFFINGVLVATGTNANAIGSSTAVMYVGVRVDGNHPWFGYISNLRIVKGTAVYTSNFLPPTEPLTATTNTVLLTCQNSNPHNNHTFINSATGTSNLVVSRSGNATQGSLSPYAASWGGHFASGQYISTPASSEFAFGTGDFTVECWLNPLAQTGVNIIQSSASNSWGLITFGSQVYWQQNGGNFGTAAGTVPLNTWSHIAVTRSSGTLRRFLNGVLLESATDNFNYTGTSGRQIGHTGGGAPFWLSNVRIVKGTALYTANFTPSTSPLTAVSGTSLLTLQNDQFIDNSSNKFALTATGTPTPALNNISSFALNTLPTPTTYSGYFDGTGDYLQIPYIADHALTTANFTIETWIYPLTTNVARGIANSWSAGGQIVLWLTSANKTSFVYSISGTSPTVTGATSISPNVWTHIAVVRNGTNLSIYVNGVLDLSHNIGTNSIIYSSGAKPLQIGLNADGGNPFNGYISNFRIVKGTAVYTSNFTPTTSPLTAISGTALLTCQNSTFVDNSTNNSTITSFGQAKPSAINPFGSTSATADGYSVTKFKGSAYFDRTGDYLSIPTNPAFNLGTGNFTIECWAYITGSTTNNGIWHLNTSAWPSAAGLAVAAFGNSGWRIYHTGTVTAGGSAPVANTWYHLALVRRGTSLILYVNGVSTISVVDSTSYGNSALQVGGYYSTNELMAGYVSDFRILKETALYTSNFLPSSTPLTATANTTLLLDFAAGSIVDATGKNVIETVGDVRISDKAVKYGTTAMYFDGTGDWLHIPPSTNFEFGSGDFTVEFWFYTASTSRQWFIHAATDYWFGIDYNSTGANKLGLWASSNGTSWNLLNADGGGNGICATTLPQRQWNHIAVVRSGNVWRVFLNGTQDLSVTVAGSIVNRASEQKVIGSWAISAHLYPVNGYLSDFRVTKGTARYTANFTPPTAELPEL